MGMLSGTTDTPGGNTGPKILVSLAAAVVTAVSTVVLRGCGSEIIMEVVLGRDGGH